MEETREESVGGEAKVRVRVDSCGGSDVTRLSATFPTTTQEYNILGGCEEVECCGVEEGFGVKEHFLVPPTSY